jgi:hypothetical protein
VSYPLRLVLTAHLNVRKFVDKPVTFFIFRSTIINEWTYLDGWKKRPLVLIFKGGVLEGISLGNI